MFESTDNNQLQRHNGRRPPTEDDHEYWNIMGGTSVHAIRKEFNNNKINYF